MLQNYLVFHIRQRNGIQIIFLHEFGENISTQNHCARYHYFRILEIVQDVVGLNHRINKGQTAPFSAERTLAYTGKIGILVEPVALKNGYHTPVFNFPIRYDGIKNNLTNPRQIGFFLRINLDVFQKFRKRKHSP